jgi:hypothetical protein
MQKRFKYLAGALLVTALALVASAVAPPRAEAALRCNQISCTNSFPCNVDACGGVGFCGATHHCVPL